MSKLSRYQILSCLQQLRKLTLSVFLLCPIVMTLWIASATADQNSFNAAQKEYALGNYDKVLILLPAPTDLQSMVLRGRAQIWKSRTETDYFGDATRKYPKDSRSWFGLALFDASLGNYSECKKCLERALSLDPNNAQALALLGMCTVRNGQEEEGVRLLESAIKKNAHDATVLEFVAGSYDTLMNPELTEKWYDRLIKEFPNNPRSWTLKGQFLQRLGQPQQARACYSKALSINPRFEEAYLLRAKSYFHQDHLAEAVKDCTSCIKLNSASGPTGECLRLRGSCYNTLSEPAKAIADFKQFLQQTKGMTHPTIDSQQVAFIGIAEAEIALKKFSEARHYLATLERAKQKPEETLELEAKIKVQTGDYSGAIADYNKLLSIDNSNPDWLSARADLQKRLAKKQK